jgi:hypothetical protein
MGSIARCLGKQKLNALDEKKTPSFREENSYAYQEKGPSIFKI